MCDKVNLRRIRVGQRTKEMTGAKIESNVKTDRRKAQSKGHPHLSISG